MGIGVPLLDPGKEFDGAGERGTGRSARRRPGGGPGSSRHKHYVPARCQQLADVYARVL